MVKISLKDIKFKETCHLAYSDEYITSYVSVNCVPTIYVSENTPRDKAGFVSGKAIRWSDWVFIEEFIDLLKKGDKI